MSLQERKSSISANAEVLELTRLVLAYGPPTHKDMEDLRSIRRSYLDKLVVPCSNFLKDYDVNSCGVCDGARCSDWNIYYDTVTAFPHVYKYVNEDWQD